MVYRAQALAEVNLVLIPGSGHTHDLKEMICNFLAPQCVQLFEDALLSVPALREPVTGRGKPTLIGNRPNDIRTGRKPALAGLELKVTAFQRDFFVSKLRQR